ncbi:ATP-binding protein [Streptomyces physcomitrii]|uniref:ATP-binding protein n=1 Tax=Streptomyces physcomitrii TaxID=2724184 RepID=UPI003433671A
MTTGAHPPPVPARGHPADPPSDHALCTLAATPEAPTVMRRFAGAMARRWGLAGHTCESLALVVTELVTNAVRHSGSPVVTLRLSSGEGTLRAEVHDIGRWRHAPVPAQGPGDGYPRCGRGLALVRAHTTRTVARLTTTGTTMLAEFVTPPDGAQSPPPPRTGLVTTPRRPHDPLL